MPDWVAEVLKQSPAAALCIGASYYVIRLFRTMHREQVADLQREHDKHLASKQAELDRLIGEIDALKKERDKWLRQAMGRDKS